MAKFYILSDYEKETGKRRKTPRQWKKVCLILAACIIAEHIGLAIYLFKG